MSSRDGDARSQFNEQDMQLYLRLRTQMESRIKEGSLGSGDTVVEFKASTRASCLAIGMALVDDFKQMWPGRTSAIVPAFRPKGNSGYGTVYILT